MALYDKGRQAFASGSIAFLTDTIRCQLVRTIAGAGAGGNTVYTPSLASDQFLSDVPSNAYCLPTSGQAQALTTKGDTAGVLTADNVTFTSVPTGDAIQGFFLYKDTGTAGTSPLILFEDGKCTVTVASDAAAHATTIKVDPLPAAIASGTSITFTISSVTVTLTGNASKGARSISVADIGATGINAGDSGPAVTQNANLPINPNTGNLQIVWDGTFGIGKL